MTEIPAAPVDDRRPALGRRRTGRPALEGLEDKWATRWEADGTYAFDRSKSRAEIYAIDTPPPTASGTLHFGSVCSYTQCDVIARYQRMRGKEVFYPMAGTTTVCPPSAACRTTTACAAIRRCRTTPTSRRRRSRTRSGRCRSAGPNFVELCERLTAEDEVAFEALCRQLGLSVDWSYLYRTISADARATSQRGFLRNLARGEAYQPESPTLWDVTFQSAVAQAGARGSRVSRPLLPGRLPPRRARCGSRPPAPS